MQSMNKNDNTNYNGLNLLCKVIEGTSKTKTSFESISKSETAFASTNKDLSAKYSHDTQFKKLS